MAEVRELTVEERAWVVRMVEAATAIADAYHLAPPPGQPMEPERLDTLWRSWLPDPGFAGQDPMLFLNPFGLALGQWLVDRTGLEWRMATDERGTGAAIWGEAGDVLVLPVDIVRKGYESRSAAFFAAVAREVEEQVRARREGTPDPTAAAPAMAEAPVMAEAPEMTEPPAGDVEPGTTGEPPTTVPPAADVEPRTAAEPGADAAPGKAEAAADSADRVVATEDEPRLDTPTATSEPRKRTGLGRFFGRR